MGYEVQISFYEKQADGEDFNRDDLKVKIAKLGDPLTEVAPDHLAAHIMKEFSRSDIWVDKVEIFEWVKKSVSFKEAKGGGVLIGGKKYNPSLNEIMKLAAEAAQPQPQQPLPPQQPQPQPQPQYQQQPQPQQQQSPLILPGQQQQQQQQPMYEQQQPQYQQPPQQYPQQPGRKVWPHEQIQAPAYVQGHPTYAGTQQEAYPAEKQQQLNLQNKTSMAGLRYAERVEVCDPPPELRADIPSLAITPGKQYRIMDEKPVGNPRAPGGRDMAYKIVNDMGKEVYVGCHYFRQPQYVRQETSYLDNTGYLQNTVQYEDHGYEAQQHQPRLLYQNEQPMYRSTANPGAHDPRINQALSRMDAAVRRRTHR